MADYWKDISSFSQRCEDRTPSTFSLTLNGLRIIVTRHRDLPRDVWAVRCEPWFSLTELAAKDIDGAKAEAVEMVKACLCKALAGLYRPHSTP